MDILIRELRAEDDDRGTNIEVTLDLWMKNHPSLGTAYELKEAFFDIWENDSDRKHTSNTNSAGNSTTGNGKV